MYYGITQKERENMNSYEIRKAEKKQNFIKDNFEYIQKLNEFIQVFHSKNIVKQSDLTDDLFKMYNDLYILEFFKEQPLKIETVKYSLDGEEFFIEKKFFDPHFVDTMNKMLVLPVDYCYDKNIAKSLRTDLSIRNLTLCNIAMLNEDLISSPAMSIIAKKMVEKILLLDKKYDIENTFPAEIRFIPKEYQKRSLRAISKELMILNIENEGNLFLHNIKTLLEKDKKNNLSSLLNLNTLYRSKYPVMSMGLNEEQINHLIKNTALAYPANDSHRRNFPFLGTIAFCLSKLEASQYTSPVLREKIKYIDFKKNFLADLLNNDRFILFVKEELSFIKDNKEKQFLTNTISDIKEIFQYLFFNIPNQSNMSLLQEKLGNTYFQELCLNDFNPQKIPSKGGAKNYSFHSHMIEAKIDNIEDFISFYSYAKANSLNEDLTSIFLINNYEIFQKFDEVLVEHKLNEDFLYAEEQYIPAFPEMKRKFLHENIKIIRNLGKKLDLFREIIRPHVHELELAQKFAEQDELKKSVPRRKI